MKHIVRLYPAAWRERYADEMEALLEERPLGPFDLVDLFLGALDAHLHLRGLGHASEHEKGFAMSLRIAGIAAIVGGTFWGLTWVIVLLDQLIGAAEGNVPVAFLTILAAAIGTLGALAGLSAVQARVHRRATWIAFLAPAIGILLVVVGFLGMSAIEPFWAIENVVRRSNCYLSPLTAGMQREHYSPRHPEYVLGLLQGEPWFYIWSHYKALSNAIERHWGRMTPANTLDMLRDVYEGQYNLVWRAILAAGAKETWWQWVTTPRTGEMLISFANGNQNAHNMNIHHIDLLNILKNKSPF